MLTNCMAHVIDSSVFAVIQCKDSVCTCSFILPRLFKGLTCPPPPTTHTYIFSQHMLEKHHFSFFKDDQK